jgi:NADH:ubiquinone oxidoreductase subunit F (NADH-binding)
LSATPGGARLLAGPDLRSGAESLAGHVRRLGPRPEACPDLVDALERSGLRGRGGASFPVGVKWRAVAGRAREAAVVVANGAEGEHLSSKDRVLMASRPHLVLDGALLAAGTVGAGQVVLYIGEAHGAAHAALASALAERPAVERRLVRVVASPPRYVAGEESAAVHFLNTGVATPTTIPPRPFERGVDGRPTLVQNVETLAHAALIARFGDEWYRGAGWHGSAGTLLTTVSGAVARPGVREVEAGTTVGEVILAAGCSAAPRAVLLGGYFGTWVDTNEAWYLPLDAVALRARGHALGCGVIAVLSHQGCGVCETAGIVRYLAGESAAQCGPCFFGLRALADTWERVAGDQATVQDLERLRRWAREIAGRGACRHPDGVAALVRSALHVFAAELHDHRHAHTARLVA